MQPNETSEKRTASDSWSHHIVSQSQNKLPKKHQTQTKRKFKYIV